eukprot:CAMPEP_0173433660 /NCGR_PEP_ID=MMETSP1357-20121228/11026_1 /TAXON_ID=77926 /ORGANISM="Hemiselmis rufescens, Strain PCC563" /LENGTH=169 /DNA_ID=CAMNT_0014398387 /DNA_START=46 /DNA_END=552 /DNA_ORIENTATION=-
MRAPFFILLALCLFALALSAPQHGGSNGEERLSDVLHNAASDTIDTLKTSERPWTDLLERHGGSLRGFLGGGLMGYVAGKLVMFVSMGVLKAALISGVGLVAAVFLGWLPPDLIDKAIGGIWSQRSTGEALARRTFDFNNDGKVDHHDLRDAAKALERALMNTHLPVSL